MMTNQPMNLKLALRIFGIVAIVLTIFPFIPIDNWSVRIFDFPHLQLTLLTLFALLFYFLRFEIRQKLDYVFVISLSACLFFQGVKIYPYTAFSQHEVLEGDVNAEESIKIYTSNVLQKNKNFSKAISEAKHFDADLMVFTETNENWIDKLNTEFLKKYDHTISVPLENTYGMSLYSKFKLFEAGIHYLVEDTIPSIHAKVLLPSKDTVQIYAIHPAPPTPQHNPSSVDRDAEMMKIAYLANQSSLPVIVLGDFNDVAWSETTSLFQKASGLLDLRKGRGFFSTYNANKWIMRWPLDHIFTSAEFRIMDVQLGNHVGSDHYPFYSHLSFEPELAKEQRLPAASKEILQKAFKQIKKENEEDSEQQSENNE